jgi:hypothetical protein
VSHDLLHHAEPKLFFDMMHKFELFDLYLWFVWIWIRKTKLKGIEKFRIKEKGKEAQPPSLFGLSAHSTQQAARARTRVRWQAGPTCRRRARLLARPLPLCPVGPPCRCTGPLCARAPMSLFRGPRLPVPLPSFNYTSARTARTPTETTPSTSPPSAKSPSRPPPQVPARTHFPPPSFTSPLRTHLSCACPFFELAGASSSPGLLRPNLPPAELARRPWPCSTTARQSFTVDIASPRVNFPARLLLLSLMFSLFRQLVVGDHRHQAVVPRPPGQPQLPRAFFARVESPALAIALAPSARPRRTTALRRRTRLSASLSLLFFPLVWLVTGGP